MTVPDFLVVGAQKAGTTALHEYLRRHPALFLSQQKEPHYFCSVGDGTPMTWCGPRDDRLLARFKIDRPAYDALFADAAGRPCGESSTMYFHDPEVPARVVRANPDVRIIVLLREPVARAESAWWMWHSSHVEPLSFADALAAEDERLAAGWGPSFAYRGVGMYATHLTRWLAHVPAERLLVLRSDDLHHDHPATLRRVFAFLGVDPSAGQSAPMDVNVAQPTRRDPSALSRVLLQRRVRAVGRRLTSSRLRRRMVPLLTTRTQRPPPDPTVVAGLRAAYRPEMEALQALVDWDVSAWF